MNTQKQGQWQPQAQPNYSQQQQQQQQQGYAPQRPLHPSVSSSPSALSAAKRSNSPQPTSPISPSMHINTSKVGGSPASQQQQQRSNPSSPAVGSAGNPMEIAARHYESLQQYLLAHILKGKTNNGTQGHPRIGPRLGGRCPQMASIPMPTVRCWLFNFLVLIFFN